MPEYAGMVSIDFTGARSVLGRTTDRYAIWEISGGEARQLFPASEEGWRAAWLSFRELEGGEPFHHAGAQVAAGTILPFGLGGVLAGAFRVLGRSFWGFVLIVASVMIPFAILQIVILQAVLTPELELLFSGLVPRSELEVYRQILQDHLGLFIAAGLGLGVISLFVTSFVSSALIRGGLQGFTGTPVRAGEALAASVGRTHSMAWILFLTGLVLLVAAILPLLLMVLLLTAGDSDALQVPLIIGIALLLFLVYTRYLFAPEALIAEGRRGTASLRRSWALTRGRTWPIFGTFLLVLLFGAVANFILTFPFQLVAQEQETIGAVWFVSALGSGLASVVVLPFTTVAVVHLYIDARARKEQLDPSGIRPEPAPGPP
jgi:hypothetical protein